MPVQTERMNHFGIEVVSGVTWKGWEPGGEYTKQIVLKNVQIKTQKLKYKVPSTRFFTTLYPKPIVLSSGTSFVLPITFRPLEKGQYEDYLEFESNEGNFSVPMRAVLPSANIAVPDNLSFGMCAVKDSMMVTFEVANNSELVTAFQWDVAEPFSLHPASGTLAPKTSCCITATFNPKAALVYEGVAVCKYGAGSDKSSTKHTRIEGIGKFPHLVASLSSKSRTTSESSHDVLINFGEVPVQTTAEKWIDLHNFSPVNAPFQVIQPSSVTNIDTVFSCSQYHGVVAPQSTARLKVSFGPHNPGALSTDVFELVALGATNCSVIKCVGTGKGPDVALDSLFLDFGVLESGKQVNRTFKVVNTSTVPAAFQFMIDCKQSVFKLDTVCGLLAGNTSQTIVAHFNPIHAINYYRKLACLVQNQDPLYINLFGTCHTELVKPAVLQKKHLDRYEVHVKRGFSKTAPEQLNELLREKKLELDEEGTVIARELQTGMSSEEHLNHNLSPMEEFFDGSLVGETTRTEPHVSLDVRNLDFGRIPDPRAVEQKTINITNHTKGKITCMWMKDSQGIFSVTPEQFDILPLRTASFRVTFRPNAADQFFSAELECYTFYKSMRDYRLVEDNTLCPPWCLTLNSSGHTFTMGTETFIPRCQWDAKHLVFPAVTSDCVSYKTLLLTNLGSNPVHFDFEEDPSGIFTCQPNKGLLTDKYQLVVFRMTPPEAKAFKHTVKCQLNDAHKFTEDILLTGSAEVPQVQFDTKGPLYFKPTCLGTASTKSLAVRNTSRIPLWFHWSIPGSDAKVLSIEPTEGMILPNDVQLHVFTFTPLEETKYLAKAKLHVRSTAEKDRPQCKKKYLVRAIGEGAVGSILCTEPMVNLGDVVVGSSVSTSLTIHNNSNCSLQYNLLVDQEVQGAYDDENTNRHVMALELSKTTGVIPARTSQQINAIAFPTQRVAYNFKVSYELLSTNDDGKKFTSRHKTPLTELHCQGVYPTLAVSDIRCLGSGKSFSKVQLWKLFSLDSFNECLDADPSSSELMYTAATRHSTSRRIPVYTRAIMDFNFSAAPIGEEPCTVHLNLKNTGTVLAEWAFLYPSDLQLELEYWAETGEYSADELHEMQVTDSKLFTVEPRKGTLAPGESKTVILSYRHLFIGTNKLPVLFKVSKGREILLNFIGVTVDPESYYVHFSSTKHMFEPVPIGCASPPVQVYELYNGGAQVVKYQLELEPLAQVEAVNYGCRVLECLNPTGEIQPGCSALIHWVFAPLEAKTYMVDIPVCILGGDTMLVTFTGVGYDQRIMGSTMPFRDEGSAVPEHQFVQITQQLANLSVERIAFGNIPLFSISQHVFVLTNNSKDHIISFRWILEGTPVENVIMIQPYNGYLRPQQDVLLKISFFSCVAPSLYDLDIICEIIDETKMAEYNQQMIEWTNRQEEKQYTFTITEADLKAEKTLTRPHSGPRLASLNKSQKVSSRSEGDLRKYHTLPPICTTKTPEKESKRKTRGRQTPPQPTPPEAFLLHLGVTARTHSIAEFYQNFPSSVQKFFIDQRYVASQGCGVQETEKLATLASCSKEELDVTADILSVVLRGLLEDDSFQHSLHDVAKEPVPYFRQLCESTYPSSRPLSAVTNGSRDSQSQSDFEPVDGDIEVEPELDFGQQTPPNLSEDKVITRIHEATQRPPSSALSIADQLSDVGDNQEVRMDQRQAIRSLPEFESMVDSLLENTLCNILVEASRGEVNLTSRPRVVALPPNRVNRVTR